MTTAVERSDLIQAHDSPPPGMVFYNSLGAVRSDVNLLGYVSVIERAWKEMKIHGVLCLDARPVLYLKEHSRPFSIRERIHLQKLFWNQGVANILVLADPKSVYIYSGLTKPQDENSIEDKEENALIETLSLTDYTQRIQTLFHDLATGHYYEKKQSCFDPNQTVDSWLLDNLRGLRNALILGDEGLTTKEAHAFIGRVLFLCYLLDRGIVSIGTPAAGHSATMLLAELLDDNSYDSRLQFLYGLFNDLKHRFNGNMFDQDLDTERRILKPLHLNKLILFLGGHEVESGQRYLGFWPYNFKMIPVETISAIYEDFLTAEDPKEQRGRGAFYTPRFLAEMVVDTAVRDEPNILDGSFLDPACGSGIFLVILFNRLANRWIHTQAGRITYVTKSKVLQDILARQIRGVDIEETACRIACFSLYLAYLDFFDPPDLQKHMERTGRPLPKLLDYGDIPDRPAADIPVILKADFLDENTFSNVTFDSIIGNPPWQGRQSKLSAKKYLQKAPLLLKEGGTGSLLLPVKILQNQTDSFQAEWLMEVTLERVLQLADYRFLLFPNAICPAFIARFKNIPPQPAQHMIEYTAPKFNRDGLRQGVVTVNPSSRVWLPLADILSATRSKTAPVVWKRRLWGTQRDQKLLDLLQSLPPLSDLAGAPKEAKRWNKGQGFQPNTSGKSKKPKQPWWQKTDLFISTRASCWAPKCIQLHIEDCQEISDRFPSLHRTRDKRIYQAPLVLVSQGFGKVAYCDFDVLFQHSLQSIAGPCEDSELLMFLTAFLRSKLARYFLFHTSANWGSERDKVHLSELLRVPFPLPGNEFISSGAGRIVKQVSQKFGKLRTRLQDTFNELKANAKRSTLFDDDIDIGKQWRIERKRQIDVLQSELEPLIYRYFGLTEQEIALVEDTNEVFEPSSTPTIWSTPKTVTLDPLERTKIEPYASQAIGAYAKTLTDSLNTWAKTEGSSYRVRAEGGTDEHTGLAMITVKLASTEAEFQKKPISRNLAKKLKIFHSHASIEEGTLLYQRDILFFQDQQIHIVRPNILLNWTRTAALNDAARIYGDIALAQGEF